MTEETTQATLRDSLEAAFEEHTEQPAETVERHRDETGKFAKRPEETTETVETPAETQPLEPEPERKAIPRPSSWKKDYEQDWETLPDRVREYLNEREGQFAKGVSTYKNQWDQAAPIYEAVQPFMPELQQHGLNPTQWIQNLGNAHRTLALGTPEEKMQMFARLATEYGVPLQALTGQQGYDPQFGMVTQKLSQLENQLSTWQQQQAQQEHAALQKQIDDFKVNAPHFEAVRDTMGHLLQSGLASDLQTAYDKAIRMNDDLWNQQQAEQARAAEAEKARAIAEKKAKAVSPKSASPTGAMNGGGGKKDLRSQLMDAFDVHGGGHI